MHKLTKTLAVSAAAAVLLTAGGGQARAYWTNSGSGIGTATKGNNVAISVVQTSVVSAMAPGIAAQALSGTFTNGNAEAVFIKTVVPMVTSTDKAGCTAADYTIGGRSVIQGAGAGAGAEIASGAAGTWSGLTIAFKNTTANQDACKNAVVTIGYTTTTF